MNRYHTDEEYRKSRIKAAVARNQANPEKQKIFQRRYELKKKYGITEDQYNDMLEDQNGVCRICKEECSTGKRLAVDHCHETGKVRGLLCRQCNRGLGHFDHSSALLQLAKEYLDG